MVATASNLVTLTIDGQEVKVPRGTVVVEAAKLLGIDIPIFCYHPKLSIIGACRMCMVEIEAGGRPPAVLTACTTQVAEGMVVRTTTPRVEKARRGVIEFLLINHPLDCPVCDAGGECPLQDQSHDYGPVTSRFEEVKRFARKAAPLSPLVTLDQERCIVCYRCTRFMDEIAGEPELGFFQRGYKSELRTFTGQPMRSPFHGNITEICPCGALTNATYRFRSRPWDNLETDSVCTHCAVGCNVIVDTRRNILARIRGRENEEVNELWLCDKGRFGYHFVEAEDRLTQPLGRNAQGEFEPISWEQALSAVAQRLNEIKAQHGAQAIGVIGGSRCTNEDNYVLQRVFKELIGTPNVDSRTAARIRPRPLATYGLSGAMNTIQEIERAPAVFVLASDLTEELPVIWLRVYKATKSGRVKLVVANTHATFAEKTATAALHYRPGTGATLVQGLAAAILAGADTAALAARIDGLESLRQQLAPFTPEETERLTGVPAEQIRAAAAALGGGALILVGPRVERDPAGEQVLDAVYNLALVTGSLEKPACGLNVLVEHNNSRGAIDVGVVPGEGGLSTSEMLQAAADGQLKALYLVGANPLRSFPDAELARRAIANLEFLVVQDLFMTEVAVEADVVLPALSFAEKDGTFTNVEGRIQRIHRALEPKTQGKADWQILTDLAAALGTPFPYESAGAITADILRNVPGYARALAQGFGSAGALVREEPRGERPWRAAPVHPPAPAPQLGPGELVLTTGRVLFGDSVMVERTPQLLQQAPEPFVELNHDDAERLGIQDGAQVELSTARGSVRLRARVNRRVPAGTAYAPDNHHAAALREILDWNEPLPTVRIAAC